MTHQTERERGKAALIAQREQLIRILGTMTVDLIIQRAALEIILTYPAMALIGLNEHTPRFDQMDAALEGKTDDEVRAAFDALTEVISLIIARLMGKEIAGRLFRQDGARGSLARTSS